MNNNKDNNQKSGYRVRRSSMSREEARKKTVRRPPEPPRIPEQTSGDTDRIRYTNADYAKGIVPEAPPVQEAPKPKKKSRKNHFIKPTDIVRVKGSYDRILLILVIVLTLFGLVMDFSASYAYSFSRYGDSFHYVRRQAIFALGGFAALLVIMRFDYRWMRKATVPAFIIVCILLVLVLVKGVASGVAQRWIGVGPITIQPSEFMKTAIVLLLALYVARNQDRITNYRNFWQSSLYGMFIPTIVVVIACGLIALE